MEEEDVIALAYNEWIPTNQNVSLRAAFFAGWEAREQAPNTLIIDTTHAQMKPIPNSSAAAPQPLWIENRDQWLKQSRNIHAYHGFKAGPLHGCNAMSGDIQCSASLDEHCHCGVGDHRTLGHEK